MENTKDNIHSVVKLCLSFMFIIIYPSINDIVITKKNPPAKNPYCVFGVCEYPESI